MSSVLEKLPIELQYHVIYMLCDQKDLVNLSVVSKKFYKLATKSLYSKIYLNDSCIESSNVCDLAPAWTWLPLTEKSNNDDETEEANEKFKLLLRSIEENKELCNNVIQVRLNWDLDIKLQVEFVRILTSHSKSLKILENITDPMLSDVILDKKYSSNLISLDLPPPNTLPSLDIDYDYLPWLETTLQERLRLANITNIKCLTVFMDPVLLFNKVIKLDKKLEIESFKIHCRADAYPTQLYSGNNIFKKELKDVFDVKYLKELTIISWFDQYFSPERIFKFQQWREFRYLQDITMIAVTFDDKLISDILNNCFMIKRLKLDFSQPQRDIGKESLIYQSIFNHSKTIEFLDIKLSIKNKIINLDLRTLKIVLRIICPCGNCQDLALKEIFGTKILPLESDFLVTSDNFQHFPKIDFFTFFATSSLSPYSKAIDRYPAVKTGPDDIKVLLERFNEENSDREHFKPLVENDFYILYNCLIHNMKQDMEPFINFPNLKFMVLNDIAFIYEIENELKFPKPLFYNDKFETNFDKNIILDKNDDENSASINSMYFLN